MQAQYPLYGVVSVKTRTTEEPKNAFVLASVNPPFKVSLASNSEEVSFQFFFSFLHEFAYFSFSRGTGVTRVDATNTVASTSLASSI